MMGAFLTGWTGLVVGIILGLAMWPLGKWLWGKFTSRFE